MLLREFSRNEVCLQLDCTTLIWQRSKNIFLYTKVCYYFHFMTNGQNTSYSFSAFWCTHVFIFCQWCFALKRNDYNYNIILCVIS